MNESQWYLYWTLFLVTTYQTRINVSSFSDQVLVPKDEGNFMGKMVEVQITSAGEHFQIGKVVKNSEICSPGLVEPLPKGMVSGIQSQNTCAPSSFNFYLKIAMFILLVAVIADVARLWVSWLQT